MTNVEQLEPVLTRMTELLRLGSRGNWANALEKHRSALSTDPSATVWAWTLNTVRHHGETMAGRLRCLALGPWRRREATNPIWRAPQFSPAPARDTLSRRPVCGTKAFSPPPQGVCTAT